MNPRVTLRIATGFYFVMAFLSLLYAWIFGHVDRLFGELPVTGAAARHGLLIGVTIVAFTHVLYRLSRFAREASHAMAEFLGPLTVPHAIVLALLSGFAEELCFRGALWPHLGLAGTSILFGLMHTVPVRRLALYPVFAALAGVVFGSLRESSGSVWPAMIAHATVNAINLAFLGAHVRRSGPPAPPHLPTDETDPREDDPLRMPDAITVEESFPITVWRYDLRVELRGTDRETLQDCLEHEDLALFTYVDREEVYRQLGEGLFVFARTFPEPFPAFPRDIATLSTYLFQPVVGIEVAERFRDQETTDDVRAWKIVAQRGEWVKVPLLVEATGGGKFGVDQDREDQEVLAAHWAEYPRWFQDGMRFKYPRLRDL